jgi:hypothetical protein
MPMNAIISAGLRRTSLMRSAADRSGLATTAEICDADKLTGPDMVEHAPTQHAIAAKTTDRTGL